MSEFSESFHLVAGELVEGHALLERAGCSGWVFPSVNGWVTVVPDEATSVGDVGQVDPELLFSGSIRTMSPPVDSPVVTALLANQVLVWFLNYEDHGWAFGVWKGGELISDASVEWTFDNFAFLDGLNIAATTSALTSANPFVSPDRLGELLASVADGENLADEMAILLGWGEAAWLSSDYLRTGATFATGPSVPTRVES
jgi:hypothetical protein